MSFSFLLGFLLFVGIGLWFWRDSLGAREQARAASTVPAGRAVCNCSTIPWRWSGCGCAAIAMAG